MLNLDLPTATVTTESGKGRSFQALLLAWAVGPSLWELGQTDSRAPARPVWAAFCGSDEALRPFVANLRLGRPVVIAEPHDYRRHAVMEFPKSVRYAIAWQRHAVGTVVTMYLPDFFALDPGMVDPSTIGFVTLASAQQDITGIPIASCVAHALRIPFVQRLNTPPTDAWQRDRWEAPLPADRIAELVPLAYLFARQLDGRTRAPIIADGRFYVQLLLAALATGQASFAPDRHERAFGVHSRLGFTAAGFAEGGYAPPVVMSTTHAQFEALLAAQVGLFFALTGPRPALGERPVGTTAG